MLPQTLLCLLSVATAFAQATPVPLPLNKMVMTLPNSDLASIPGPGSGDGIVEITLNQGLGAFTGPFPNGGVLAVSGQGPFEVGVSDSGPIHESLDATPLLGDTTSNQAIVFSAPFADVEPSPELKYPNYTLPQANLTFPQFPQAQSLDFSLILAPTSSRVLTNILQTGCSIRASQSSSVGTVINQTLWLRDEYGWRNQWLIGGLNPSTNYTAYVIQNDTKVSGPIYFATKSAAFPCSLVHSLSYCPSVAYSVPLDASLLPSGYSAFDSTSLPSNVSKSLLSSLTNFTTNLLTFPCGRDMYSPLVTCEDCQAAYRRWLCAVSFVRCSEPSPQQPGSFTTTMPAPIATGMGVRRSQQQVLSALVPVPTPTSINGSNPRNPSLPGLSANYLMLLPCLETCNAAARACPPLLQFKCPVSRFNAGASYGVGYIDGFGGDQGKGATGVAQDRWGNVWCNGV
ncbi:hypothetical protein APHAL10511_003115 [Amanita phalloides]|nr:hypothetical protein APHAL10511_003115 [Amanita phalloides]